MRRMCVSMAVLVVAAGTGICQAAEEGCAKGQGPDQQGPMKEGKGMQQPGGERMGGGMRPGGDMQEGGWMVAMAGRLVHNPKVAEKLGLTEAQVKTLKDQLFVLKKEEITLKGNLELASLEQAKSLTEQKVSEDAVMKAVEKTGAARTAIAKLNMRIVLLVKNTLTAEQIEKAKQMMMKRFEEGKKGGQDQGRSEAKGNKGSGAGRGQMGHERGGEGMPPPAPEQDQE